MDIFSAVRMVLERECPELELRTEEPMARHTTFRVGGPARLMAFPKDKKEIKAAVRAADQMGVVPFFLGNGSNLLVADKGVEAFVIKTGGLDQVREVNRRLRAECGIPLSRLAMAALGRGLTGQEHTVPAEQCQLTYRHSVFTDHPAWLVLEAEMELEQGDAEEIRAKMEDLAQRRKSKQPLEYPSAGSTFKRPAGHFAAALIEQCGLKGLTVGGAQVSEKHAGFVINRGGATCADILKLTDQIKETVLRETGVALELEVRTLGCV